MGDVTTGGDDKSTFAESVALISIPASDGCARLLIFEVVGFIASRESIPKELQ